MNDRGDVTPVDPPARRHTFGTGQGIVVDRCQSCGGGALEPVLFIGYLPPVNALPPIGSRAKEIFHAKRIPTHGGSIRVYAARRGSYDPRTSVQEMLDIEAARLGPSTRAHTRPRSSSSAGSHSRCCSCWLASA